MKKTPLSRRSPLRSREGLARQSALERRARIRPANHARRARERLRAYGPASRIQWLLSHPCIVRGCRRAPEVTHVTPSTGLPSGMGRKGDARWTVPCCPYHHRLAPFSIHRAGETTFQRIHRLDLPATAAALEASWQEMKS